MTQLDDAISNTVVCVYVCVCVCVGVCVCACVCDGLCVTLWVAVSVSRFLFVQNACTSLLFRERVFIFP